jgi:uncharacterized membrane protein
MHMILIKYNNPQNKETMETKKIIFFGTVYLCILFCITIASFPVMMTKNVIMCKTATFMSLQIWFVLNIIINVYIMIQLFVFGIMITRPTINSCLIFSAVSFAFTWIIMIMLNICGSIILFSRLPACQYIAPITFTMMIIILIYQWFTSLMVIYIRFEHEVILRSREYQLI